MPHRARLLAPDVSNIESKTGFREANRENDRREGRQLNA
jgi:hypothetical protein